MFLGAMLALCQTLFGETNRETQWLLVQKRWEDDTPLLMKLHSDNFCTGTGGNGDHQDAIEVAPVMNSPSIQQVCEEVWEKA